MRLFWILVYGSMALVCIIGGFRFFLQRVLIILLIVFVSYSVMFIDGVREWLAQEDRTALFDDIAKMEHVYIEEAREFLGLMICILVILMQLVISRRRRKQM